MYILVIGSLSNQDKIKEVAQYYTDKGHNVSHVYECPDMAFIDIVRNVFYQIQTCDRVVVIPKSNGTLGRGTLYEMAYAETAGTECIIWNESIRINNI